MKPIMENMGRDVFEIGMAVATGADGPEDSVVGRITAFQGDSYDGLYPRMDIYTPHGSKIHAGRCYVRHELLPREKERLEEYEKEAWEKEGKLYENLLPGFQLRLTFDEDDIKKMLSEEVERKNRKTYLHGAPPRELDFEIESVDSIELKSAEEGYKAEVCLTIGKEKSYI